MVMRRRAAPGILRLGGITHGSGQFFGQSVMNKTTVFRELQDIENLKKFANGDPETFLAYWAERQKTMRKTSPLYAHMQAQVARAEKKVKQNKEDADAVSEYARTNNHQKYLNHILDRLANEEDPAAQAKWAQQADSLRTRIFRASAASGALGGGVSQQDLTDAEQEFRSLASAAKTLVDERGGIASVDEAAPVDLKRLGESARNYNDLLTRIAGDSGAPAKARSDATKRANSTERTPNSIGPNYALTWIKSVADARQISDLGFDEKGNNIFKSTLTSTTDRAARAKLLADRAYAADTLSRGLHLDVNKAALAASAKAIQVEANKAITVVAMETSALPKDASDRMDRVYSAYTAEMRLADATPIDSPTTFKRIVKNASSREELLANLKITEDVQDHLPENSVFLKELLGPNGEEFFKARQEDANAGEPATWDTTTNSWKGSAESIRKAQTITEATSTILQVQGNQYTPYLTKDPSEMTPGDLLDLSTGYSTGQAQLDLAQRQSQMRAMQEHAAQEREDMAVAQPVEGAGVAPIEGSPEETAYNMQQEASKETGMGKRGLQSMMISETDDQADYTSALDGIDSFMTEVDIPELPDWEAPAPNLADMETSFPFSTQPSAGLPPQPTDTYNTIQRGRPF
jgi:hypothetical protein